MVATDTRAGLFPALLKHWRARRGLSQLDLACAADVSSRHISFLETGRSAPSEDMVLRLATTLDVPLRAANALLRAAGYPPRYAEDEALPASVRRTLDLMKRHHDPYPLMVIDRSYRLVDLNDGALAFLASVGDVLEGLELTDLNLAEFAFDSRRGGRLIRNHKHVVVNLLHRMHHELLSDPDNDELRAVLQGLLARDDVPANWRTVDLDAELAATLDVSVQVGQQVWSFVLVVSQLLAPQQVALDELRVEQWFPADDVTALGCAQALARLQSPPNATSERGP